MKTKKFTEIKVGIFVVVILFLFGAGVFVIGSHQKYFQRQYTLWASFSNIEGLIVGAPVKTWRIPSGSTFVSPKRISSGS